MRKNEMGRSIIRAFVVSVVLLMALFSSSTGLYAQSTTDGAIGGTVTDASGAAVPGAKVTVKNLGTNAEEAVITDDTGYFRVGKLPPATYSVTVNAQGFAPFTVEHVVVQIGSVTDVLAKLNVASAGATVVVTAEIPQVNTNSAEFAPTVDQSAISNLPINGGRWSNFVLLTPGAVNDANGFGLISFRGMSTLLNNNTVDGGDNNQAFFSEERGRTRIGYSSAKAAVQEFQVNTSNYSAEYGRAAGAVVNTVTKSGSNQYHGEVYFYDRDNSWGAFNPFTTLTKQTSPGVFTTSPYNPVDVRKMYGFGVGGPIKKDKIFFFFAFDRYDRNFPGTAKATSPTAFFASPLTAITSAYTVDGTTNCFQSNGSSNINSKAFTSGSSAIPNGGNIATATVGACTLVGNLSNANVGIATYSDAVTAYNNGLNGLINETGPVPRKGQTTLPSLPRSPTRRGSNTDETSNSNLRSRLRSTSRLISLLHLTSPVTRTPWACLPTSLSPTVSTWAFQRSCSALHSPTSAVRSTPTPFRGPTASTLSNLAWTWPTRMT